MSKLSKPLGRYGAILCLMALALVCASCVSARWVGPSSNRKPISVTVVRNRPTPKSGWDARLSALSLRLVSTVPAQPSPSTLAAPSTLAPTATAEAFAAVPTPTPTAVVSPAPLDAPVAAPVPASLPEPPLEAVALLAAAGAPAAASSVMPERSTPYTSAPPASATATHTRVPDPTLTPTTDPGTEPSATPTPNPTATDTVPPTSTPPTAVFPTQTPTLKPSATPTFTPMPTATATPRPTPTPSDDLVDVTPGVMLRAARMSHTATRLADGRVLLVGGSDDVDYFLDNAEIFDPETGQTRRATHIDTPRHAHSATLLADGRVLVIGGYNNMWGWLSDAEIYDPTADTWMAASPLFAHGVIHSATRMKDGRVLVVGGNIGSSWFTERVEIFDPQTNSWTEGPPLPGERANHTAQLLEDGRVLVAGGQTDANGLVGGDALLYDPQANTWTATGPMVKPRLWAQSVRLQDGRVLVAGGMTLEEMPMNVFSASAEIYDPASNAWSAAPAMSQQRYSHFLALLPNGRVLAVGGARDWECCWTSNSFVREIEVFDPAANRWWIAGQLSQPRAQAAAALLPDGRVWLTGGRWSYTEHGADSWLIGARVR